MKLVHINWHLIGQIGVVDDDGEMQMLDDGSGQVSKTGTVSISIKRFRGNEIQEAYQEARKTCEDVLAQAEKTSVAETLSKLEEHGQRQG